MSYQGDRSRGERGEQMSEPVRLIIDGKEVQAPEGMNLIEAAELNGIHIPNLCYLKGLRGIGACRLCLVEIEGMKSPVTACTTKVRPGMVVLTKTEGVQEIRRFVIDLILSMHPLDCLTCTKAGLCHLQRYAYDFEVRESTFTRKKFGYPTDSTNPFIRRDPDYCILCGRCVRICKEQDTSVLAFTGRGVGSKVTTPGDKPLQDSGCTFCGSCIDVCPVNAFLEANRWRRSREWDYKKIDSVCLLCGDSCDITVSTKDGKIMKIDGGVSKDPIGRYICAYGRFGFDCIEAENRVLYPLRRINGELREITWDEAIEIVARELKKAREEACFLSTASIPNEDALTLKRFASEVVKSKNIVTTASLYADRDTLVSGRVEIESVDLFILVDLNPSQWTMLLPALDATIRKRVKTGAKLITINSSSPKIAEVATVNIQADEAEALMSLTRALIQRGLEGDKGLALQVAEAILTEAINKASILYLEAKDPLILTSPAMYQAARNLALLKGRVVSIPLESNAKGVVMMGLFGGRSYNEILSSRPSLLYAIGEIPLSHRPEVGFLVLQNSHLTELARQADLVLPSAAYLEVEGTIVDYLGRWRHVQKVVEPAGMARPHKEIFKAIAKAMGIEMEEATEDEARQFAEMEPEIGLLHFKRKKGLNVKADELVQSLNTSVIKGSRLAWLKPEAWTCKSLPKETE